MSADGSEPERLVGSDRVLAALVALAEHPRGVTLDELSQALHSPKSTVHRALMSLRRAGFATQTGRGVYVLGDEFLRLAFLNHAARPDTVFVGPILGALVDRFHETAHFGVLEGREVVYRAKVDPPDGAIRLSSAVGGRNPAYRTAVGKVLLADAVGTEAELRAVLGDALPAPVTDRTITSIDGLWRQLAEVRANGFAVDDQENERGVNCIAVPLRRAPDLPLLGAVSVSALAFRHPLADLVARIDEIRTIVG